MIAIDLGSNTLRAVEFDCRTLEPVESFEKIVRTADGMHESGKIGEAAVERIVEASKEAKKILDFSQPVAAVTTQALRKASNAEDVLERIRRECGIEFRVIDGDEEAQYTLLAVKKRLEKIGMESEKFVLADLGGGSTEILFFDSKICRKQEVGRVRSETIRLYGRNADDSSGDEAGNELCDVRREEDKRNRSAQGRFEDTDEKAALFG